MAYRHVNSYRTDTARRRLGELGVKLNLAVFGRMGKVRKVMEKIMRSKMIAEIKKKTI
ncbi:MAG: hypothetical protein KAS75_01750 [Planctomycetes bacterium]|nr:hypothetical protein [Planctomycetota bacterium]